MVQQDLYAGYFNVQKKESYETDPEKINFAKNLDELKDRWRKVLKTQVISQYLDLELDQKNKLEKATKQDPAPEKLTEEELWKEAIAKVSKRNKNFFQRLRQATKRYYPSTSSYRHYSRRGIKRESPNSSDISSLTLACRE